MRGFADTAGIGRRAFEPDQIDLAARGRERHRVILHARAAAQISDYDNGGSH